MTLTSSRGWTWKYFEKWKRYLVTLTQWESDKWKEESDREEEWCESQVWKGCCNIVGIPLIESNCILCRTTSSCFNFQKR